MSTSLSLDRFIFFINNNHMKLFSAYICEPETFQGKNVLIKEISKRDFDMCLFISLIFDN